MRCWCPGWLWGKAGRGLAALSMEAVLSDRAAASLEVGLGRVCREKGEVEAHLRLFGASGALLEGRPCFRVRRGDAQEMDVRRKQWSLEQDPESC